MIEPKRLIKTSLILLSLVVIIGAYPYIIYPQGTDFTGVDEQALALINKEHPDYTVWRRTLWQPPNQSTENLLFALQAAVGLGVLLFSLSYLKNSKKSSEDLRELIEREKDAVS